MKKIILSGLLIALFALPCRGEELYRNDTLPIISVEKPCTFKEFAEITQDTAKTGIPIFYYFYQNHKYQSKAAHFAITNGMIALSRHIPIVKKHPNITAIAISAGYFLVWDVCIEKQADAMAAIADGLGAIVNLKVGKGL